MEQNQIMEIKQADMLQAIDKAEVDVQIATAKAYPRDVNAALKRIENLAIMDQDTAAECFYVLRRRGSNGQDSVIEGLSVRMAEIIAGQWGNLRVQTRIIGNDGRNITAQAACLDLETNYAVLKEVRRRITDKNGKTYSEDMQVLTGNAAAAIAYRNAVLTVIPKAVTKKVVNNIRQVALGQTIDLETNRQQMIAYFKQAGVSEEHILFYLDKKSLDEVGKEDILDLRGAATAIKEGTSTAKELFLQPYDEAKKEEAARKKSATAKDKAAEAMQRASKGGKAPAAAPEPATTQTPMVEVVDEETGEVTMQPQEQEEAQS